MFKKQSLSLALAMCLSSGVGQALANEPFAQIKSIEGDAMVTQGERFITAREGMALQQLDRVVVLEQGGAMIEFADGCRYQMQEMELLTVGSKSACATQAAEYQVVKQTATSQIAAGGSGGAGGGAGAAGAGAGAGAAGAGAGAGAAGAGAGAGAAGGAAAAGAAGAGAAGLGTTIAGLGAATGLGTAGIIGAGTLVVAGTAAAVDSSNNNNNNNNNAISPE